MVDSEVGGLVITIRATAENLERVAEEARERLRGIGTAAEQTRKPMKAAGQAGRDAGKDMAAGAKEAQLAWLALYVVAIMVFRQIGNAINQGTQDVNEYKDAMRGLNSVATNTRIASSALEAATAKVTDQFFNAAAAATAFKNLLLRGYSLDQATETIVRLKDAAAFGRQASLSLAQAVKSATEGLKNENSILVDNAGVTKNVAKMWEEYAKTQGLSVANMTQAQKVEAEYLGIQKETAAMQGDILKLQEQLSGKMAAAENQAYLLSIAYGEAMTPLKAAGTELKTGFLEVLTGIVATFPGITTGATTATAAILVMGIAIVGLQKGKKIIDELHIALQAMNMSLGTIGWIALGIGAVVAAYTYFTNAAEQARIAEEKRIAQNREAVITETEHANALRTTIDRYVELRRKHTLSYTEAYDLVQIEGELATQYGVTRDELDKLVTSTDNYAESLNGVINAAIGTDAIAALKKQAADSRKLADEAAKTLDAFYSEKTQFIRPSILSGREIPVDIQLRFDTEAEEKYSQEFEKTFSTINKMVADGLALVQRTVEVQGGEFSAEVAQIMTGALIPQIDLKMFDSSTELVAFFDALTERIGEIASSPAIVGAQEVFTSVRETLMQGVIPNDEDIESLGSAWEAIFGEESPIRSYFRDLVDAGQLTEQEFNTVMADMVRAVDPLNVMASTFDATKTNMINYISSLKDVGKTVADAKTEIGKLNTEYADLNATLEKTRGWSKLYAEWTKLNAAGKDTTSVYKQMDSYFKAFDRTVDNTTDSVGAFNDHIEWTSATAQERLAAITERGYELDGILYAIANDANIDAEIRIDAADARNELLTLLQLIFTTIASLAEIGEVKTRGGGGRRTEPTPSYSAPAESAYDIAIAAMEHLKALDQLTYEQELANLEDIARRIQMSKEEQLDLEERIYDAKKRIAERDAENLTGLTDAIMSALSERYAKMREAEMEALDQSQDAWEEWRDHNVSAIQDQIAALDALDEAENRQQTQDEHLRKIARLEQSLAYEQDAYNKLQLQKQLDTARKAYEDWLRAIDREDQRTDLRNQIDNINNQANTEIAALDDRRSELEAFYRDRMSQANLQAEAEVELMNSTQQQIIDLLADYAPEYDAMGRTLGERLMGGFVSTVGVFDAWFATFSENLAEVLAQIQAANVAAVNNRPQGTESGGASGRSVNINQQNNFNTPVESPSETARRIRRANEDLAEQIMGG